MASKAIIILASESFLITKPFIESIMEAFGQFKSCGYAEKLKAQITLDSIPAGHEDLLTFLYHQIVNI
jgi:hypothetical protein